MAMLLEFTPSGFTTEKYDTCIRELEKAGQGSPRGRLSHVAFGDPQNLRVTDVWETKQEFENFGVTLMPIMRSAGVDPGEPKVTQLHNVLIGVPAAVIH